MFEPSYVRFLYTLSGEEKELASYIRNKQIISEFKSMSDEDFDRLKEIVLKNLKEIEKLFNIYIYELKDYKLEYETKYDFEYDDLFKKYLNDILCALNGNYSVELLRRVYKFFAVPFYETKDEMIEALKNREEYIKYLENSINPIKSELLLNLYNELNKYLKSELGDEFNLQLDNYNEFLSKINELINDKIVYTFSLNDAEIVKNLIDKYKEKIKQNVDKEYSIKGSIYDFEYKMKKIEDYIKTPFIFLFRKEKEEIFNIYKEFITFNKDVNKEYNFPENYEEYDEIFGEYIIKNNKEAYKFFDKNIKLILQYFSNLKKEIEKQNYFLCDEEKEKFIKNITEMFGIISFLDQKDLRYIIDKPNVEKLKKYYNRACIKQELYEILSKYVADSDKLKSIVSYGMYIEIKNIFEDSGCKYIEISEKRIEDIRKYIEMKQKIDSFHSVTENEIVLNTFQKIKKLS